MIIPTNLLQPIIAHNDSSSKWLAIIKISAIPLTKQKMLTRKGREDHLLALLGAHNHFISSKLVRYLVGCYRGQQVWEQRAFRRTTPVHKPVAYAGGVRGGSTEPPFFQRCARKIISLAMHGRCNGVGRVLLLVVRTLSLLIPIFSATRGF